MKFPKQIHLLHYFESDQKLFVADLNQCRLLEINPLIREILRCCYSQTEEQLFSELVPPYTKEQFSEALSALNEMELEGLLFASEEETRYSLLQKERPRFFIPQHRDLWFLDITNLSAGTNISLYHQIVALAKFVDIHLAGTSFQKLSEGIYQVPLTLREVISRPWKFQQYDYDGILLLHCPGRYDYLSLFRSVEVPILMQIHAPRGHGGEAINSILLHYAMMRDYDAFTAPSDYVRKYYGQLVKLSEMFYTLPNGVEHNQFKPMSKKEAKQLVAEMTGRGEILEKPAVGFLSRVLPEKGASVFFKIAQLIPDALFIVTGQNLSKAIQQQHLKNIIYAGFQPREALPVLYNAFDVYCFPTMSGEETFGLTLLEAMACGVPPVVTDFDGLPEVVGDAGIIVPAYNFPDDIASFASIAPVEAMAEKVRWLLEHEQERLSLAEKAHKRALTFSWDKTAKRLLEIHAELKKKQMMIRRGEITVRFTPKLDWLSGDLFAQSLVINHNSRMESPLMFFHYPQTIPEGIAISLLHQHSMREVEAVLKFLLDDDQKVEKTLKKVTGFLEQIA